jgi:hypothetical protein
MNHRLTLEWLPGRYAVCRLKPDAALPAWIDSSLKPQETGLLSITRTQRETSIVIDESKLPRELEPHMPVQRGFAAMRVAGTLDFALVGILAQLVSALAAANVSVFALSTYDTDVLLVRESDRERAAAALGKVAAIS